MIKNKKKKPKIRLKVKKVRLHHSEEERLRELASRNGIKTIAGYLRKAALNPQDFCGKQKGSQQAGKKISDRKIGKNIFTSEMRKIVERINHILDNKKSIGLSEDNREMIFWDKDPILIYKK